MWLLWLLASNMNGLEKDFDLDNSTLVRVEATPPPPPHLALLNKRPRSRSALLKIIYHVIICHADFH